MTVNKRHPRELLNSDLIYVYLKKNGLSRQYKLFYSDAKLKQNYFAYVVYDAIKKKTVVVSFGAMSVNRMEDILV